MAKSPSFFVKFVVCRNEAGKKQELSRHDTYEAAEQKIAGNFPADLLGTIEFSIEKIWTNNKG